jgi:hypothetical protein
LAYICKVRIRILPKSSKLSTLAPIVLFVYNRPSHTLKTLESLKENKLASDSILYVFSDGPKEDDTKENTDKISEVRKIIKSITWSKELILNESPVNKGLKSSVSDGVTSIINQHGKVIVLEDDLLFNPNFLSYMNEGLEIYQNVSNVYSINAFLPPIKTDKKEVFLSPLATNSWGWGTWKEKWKIFESQPIDKAFIKNNAAFRARFNFADFDLAQMLYIKSSWAIRWYYAVFIHHGLGVFPTQSLVINIGRDGSGTHSAKENFSTDLYSGDIKVTLKESIDIDLYAKMLDYFTKKSPVKNKSWKFMVQNIIKKIF